MKNKFMKRAIELSENSANGTGGPFGSVIVKDEKIIAEGSNRVTSTNDPTAHAQIVAIRESSFQNKNQKVLLTEVFFSNFDQFDYLNE